MIFPIQLQWEKWIENGINDLKIDYNRVGLVIKGVFWCWDEIFDY